MNLGQEFKSIKQVAPHIWNQIQPKMFHGVHRYSDYRWPYVYWANSIAYKMKFKNARPMDDGNAAVHILEQIKAKKYGYPFFFLSPKFFNAICQTDINFTVDWSTMHFPFPAFTFVLPAYNHLDIACVSVFHFNEHGADRLYITAYRNNRTDQNVVVLSLTEPYDSTVQSRILNEMSKSEEDFGKALPPLIFNTLFAMAARPEYVESGRKLSTLKKSKSELWSPNVVGLKYATKGDLDTDSGTHASPRMHWRRGHFRQQAIGPGFTDRKIIWIEPTLVNAKVAGE